MRPVTRRVTAERFIGRTDVLAVFDDMLAGADVGRGDVVLVSGDAGVGKSRAIRELMARAQRNNALVLLGGCVDHGEEVMPLAAIADIFRDIAVQTPREDMIAVFGGDDGIL